MIVFIPLEHAVRELPGHLLFAAVAASRGHQIVIANHNEIWLYLRMGLLKPGCYLIKNLNVPSVSGQVYQRFLQNGFDLYCQDQEPSILWGRIDKYLFDRNITRNQMLPFKAVFCHGKRDTVGYSDFFAERGNVFYNTGSPRVDIWSTKFSSLHYHTIKKEPKSYFLVVSNFGWLMGAKHMSEAYRIHQSLELLGSFEQVKNHIDFLQEDYSIALSMILAIVHFALTKPDLRIVIRPHPADKVEYWRNIFDKQSNVEVIDNTDYITPWIAGATAVIQNGCTSALESVLQGVPVISYGPDRTHSDLSIPNRLGIRARTLAELDQALAHVLAGKYQATYQEQSEAILRPLVTTSGNAALAMVRIMESKSKFPIESRLAKADVLKMCVARQGKNVLDWLRRFLNVKAPVDDNITQLDSRQISSELADISEVMGLPVPKVRMISKTGLLIE